MRKRSLSAGGVLSVLVTVCLVIFLSGGCSSALQNRIEYQPGNVECSGYAAAYAIRALGDDVTGDDIYGRTEPKEADGTVTALALAESLIGMGYDVFADTGDLDTLEKLTDDGIPVLAMIRFELGSSALHFIVVTDVDDENVYTVDSIKSNVNAHEPTYNRVMSRAVFAKIWEINKEYPNVYMTVSKH